MSTPSYAAFVRRHREAHVDQHAAIERIAMPALDWIDLIARSLSDAFAVRLHLDRPPRQAAAVREPVRPLAADRRRAG